MEVKGRVIRPKLEKEMRKYSGSLRRFQRVNRLRDSLEREKRPIFKSCLAYSLILVVIVLLLRVSCYSISVTI